MKGQLEWLKVILLWKILNGDTPMTASDIQDLLDSSPCVTNLSAGQIQWIQTILLFNIEQGGGGGGDVGSCGDNYYFEGTSPNQIFKLKNPDTGLANRIDAAGVDGVQTIDVQESSASC